MIKPERGVDVLVQALVVLATARLDRLQEGFRAFFIFHGA
jgi:hypothetical protein